MAKQQSLHAAVATPPDPAAKSAPIAVGNFKMPAIFTAPSTAIQARAWAPLVTFAHPKRADEWKKLNGKFGDVMEGHPYFIYRDRMEKLDRPKLGWVYGTQWWASKAPNGDLVASSLTEKPRPWKEHIAAVCLVYFEDAIYPANVDFRTAKCPAAKVLYDAAELAKTPEWAAASDAHKESLICPESWMRFYGDCVLNDPRPAKSTGLPYRPLTCTVKPTGIAEWRLLDAFVKSPDTQTLFDMVAERYSMIMKEVAEKAVAE